MEKSKKTIVLAFSGGLDTTFCIPYFQEKGFDVITVTVDTGGFKNEELTKIKAKSKSLGTTKHIVVDAKKDYFEKIVSYIIKANALRGGLYPLLVGPERIIQAMKVIEVAKNFDAVGIAHGSTGAGNDQVRFDVAIHTLAPEMKIYAPIRELGITREEECKYLESKNIAFDKAQKDYSINHGMLGTTIGGKETIGSWQSPPEKVYPTTLPIDSTPEEGTEIVIKFKNGLPVSIDDTKMEPMALIKYLSKIGAENGVGKNVHMGDTILGIKGRVAFEAPAAEIIIKAHTELEKLTLTKQQSLWKKIVCEAYQNFVHEGLYFDPVVKDIEALIDSSQETVSGEVKVKIHKGNVIIIGSKSPYSLKNKQIAIYGEENKLWDGKDAEGFCKIYGLQSMLAYQAKLLGDKEYEEN